MSLGGRKRNPSEMSNPEIAINFEKEHLRSAEECDYMVLENLIQRRYDEEDEDDDDDSDEVTLSQQTTTPSNPALLSVVKETREFRVNSWPTRTTLRRSSAIETDSPSTYQGPLGSNIGTKRSTTNIIKNVNYRTLPTKLLMPVSCLNTGSSSDSTERQDSSESNDLVPTISQPPLPQRPSIVIDSSQLPIQREVIKKADSKGSLHMQSETMC